MMGSFSKCIYLKLVAYMVIGIVFSSCILWIGEAYDGNQREFIMAMLLRRRHPVERKSREAKNAKDFIRYISELMSND